MAWYNLYVPLYVYCMPVSRQGFNKHSKNGDNIGNYIL